MFGIRSALASIAVSFALATSASALTLTFNEFSQSTNDPATGASGEAVLMFDDILAGVVRVTATITNTTDVTTFGTATSSKLTGFGFDLLDGVTYLSTVQNGAFLDTTIEDAGFSPFDPLDLAFADDDNFNGSGPGGANSALPEGQSDTIIFDLSAGSYGNAAGLEVAFFAAFYFDGLDAGMRFQQVDPGGRSDKLLWGPTDSSIITTPLPATGLLMIAGLGALGALRRRNKKA